MAPNHDEIVNDRQALAYTELGAETDKPTILLIHGMFSSGEWWDLVTPLLSQDYHLLLPDLPGHGKSKDILPYSKELSASLLADLIRERASGGKAHVVGFSLGLYVALELASTHPEVVNTMFVSGCKFIPWSSALPCGIWLSDRLESCVPRSLVRWAMDGIDIPGSSNGAPSLSLCRSAAETISLKDDQWPSPWPAKTLIIAAGKAGLVPSSDSLHDTMKLRDIAASVQGEGKTKAYVHPDMRHPWDRQAPKLFAETVKLWFEEGRVPEGFKEL